MRYTPSSFVVLGAATVAIVAAIPMEVPTSTQLLLKNPPKMNLKSCVVAADTELNCIKHKTIRHPSYDYPTMENHPPQDEGSAEGDATYKNIESQRACWNLCYDWNHKAENFNNKCYGYSYVFNTVEASKAGKAKNCYLKKSFSGCGTRAIDEQYTKDAPYLVSSGQVRCGKVNPNPDPSADTVEEVPEDEVLDAGSYGQDVQIDDIPEVPAEPEDAEVTDIIDTEEVPAVPDTPVAPDTEDTPVVPEPEDTPVTPDTEDTPEVVDTTEDTPAEVLTPQEQKDQERKDQIREENPDVPAEFFENLVPAQDNWPQHCEAAILLKPEQMECADYKYINHPYHDWPMHDHPSPKTGTLFGSTYDNIYTFEDCKTLCTKWSNEHSGAQKCFGVAYVPDTPEGRSAQKQNTCWLKTRFMDCGRPARDSTTEVKYHVDSAQALCY